jgi:predicted nucleic-acid-binding protein
MAPQESMIAVDTNVVVRFLVADDAPQARLAKRLFAENRIAVAHTVLLETEWVLRHSYQFARDRVASGLLHLLGIETVFCERREAVLTAINAIAAGCDFADALHAATADRRVVAFATFDEDFAKCVTTVSGLPPVRLMRAAED